MTTARPVGGRAVVGYTQPTMSVKPIVLLGDPRLRLKGETVDSFGKYLHELLDDLTDSMRHAPGVGLAAPQLGEAVRACVVEVEGNLHELDHLDGKLYIDYLDSMDELIAVGQEDDEDAEVRGATSALA